MPFVASQNKKASATLMVVLKINIVLGQQQLLADIFYSWNAFFFVLTFTLEMCVLNNCEFYTK